MARHLVGLQAQENLPPYLSLAARLTSFDPKDVTAGLEDRSLVRFLTMRGTVHLLVADDALMLRQWTAPVHEREIAISQSIGPAREVDRDAFLAELSALLDDGPQPQKVLGAALAERFPGLPATQLGQLARSAAPLVQCPPRGTWKGSGGVVYQYVDRWLGRPLVEPDVEEIVRRYLRAFGPATAADVTAWSGITRLVPVVKAMDDLVTHEDEQGKPLYDVPGLEVADEDAPAPVRLLGQYDNVWLSHAGRDRVTTPETRKLWMGTNGGMASTVFADGMLVGLWRPTDGRVEVLSTVRTLTKQEKSELDDEITRVNELLARLAPAVCPGEQRGDGGDAGGGRAQHLGAEPDRASAGVRERRQLLRGQPALGADDEDHPVRHVGRQRLGRLLVKDQRQGSARDQRGDLGSRCQWRDLRKPRPPGLLGGLPGGGLPLGERLRGPIASPDGDRSRGGPGHDPGDADLGEHLDRELAPVALGQGLDHDDLGTGSRHGGDRTDHDVQPGLPGRGHLALRDVARTVGQEHGLTDREAAYGDRVVRLGTLDAHRCADVHAGQRRHQVDVQGHQRDISAD